MEKDFLGFRVSNWGILQFIFVPTFYFLLVSLLGSGGEETIWKKTFGFRVSILVIRF